jgi:hypothetical protein
MGAGKCGDVEGERVLRELEPPCDVAGGHADGSALHEQAEDLQPALLPQSAESTDRGRYFHVSKFIEITPSRQRSAEAIWTTDARDSPLGRDAGRVYEGARGNGRTHPPLALRR